ncbi:hypothetical protein VP01_6045g1 [Puccinia sorghi]|uniref:Uncharacterized protein n=1 Tax=Puccinia sorghi TaxID=27349 RepID=A0A0L6UHB0_9BASI|nr:hypothetical protein VP01_6045g1 [Puccinia sorghi]
MDGLSIQKTLSFWISTPKTLIPQISANSLLNRRSNPATPCPEEEEVSKTTNEFATADEESIDDDDDVAEILAPSSSNPPVKYSYFSEDPRTYKQATSGINSSGWINAIDSELENIENHNIPSFFSM